jgi:hypothetical protein
LPGLDSRWRKHQTAAGACRGAVGQYEIDSSPDLLTWSSNSIVTITNLNGTAQIIDTSAPTTDRFYRLKQP